MDLSAGNQKMLLPPSAEKKKTRNRTIPQRVSLKINLIKNINQASMGLIESWKMLIVRCGVIGMD